MLSFSAPALFCVGIGDSDWAWDTDWDWDWDRAWGCAPTAQMKDREMLQSSLNEIDKNNRPTKILGDLLPGNWTNYICDVGIHTHAHTHTHTPIHYSLNWWFQIERTTWLSLSLVTWITKKVHMGSIELEIHFILSYLAVEFVSHFFLEHLH